MNPNHCLWIIPFDCSVQNVNSIQCKLIWMNWFGSFWVQNGGKKAEKYNDMESPAVASSNVKRLRVGQNQNFPG